MDKKKAETSSFLEDSRYENKDSVYLDIDRIINEGMAGGNVYTAGNSQNIEEAHDFVDEDPPNVTQ